MTRETREWEKSAHSSPRSRQNVSIFAIYELKYSTLTNEEEDEEEEDDREERLLCIRLVVIANFGEEVLFRLEPTNFERAEYERSVEDTKKRKKLFLIPFATERATKKCEKDLLGLTIRVASTVVD